MAELIDNTTPGRGFHYMEVLSALHRDNHYAAHPEAVVTNTAWRLIYGTGAPNALADLAAHLDVTELELVTEARRQALEALEHRTTDSGRANTRGLIDELDEWLASRKDDPHGRD